MKPSKFLLYASMLFLSSCSMLGGRQPVSLDACRIDIPLQITEKSEKYVEARIALKALGNKIATSGVNASSNKTLEVIYQEIPDDNIACQMMTQLGACIAATSRIDIAQDYFSLIDRKDTCGTSDTSIARKRGMQTYIFLADESQRNTAKEIKISLSDRGFLVPKIGTEVFKSPNNNEVRYYYTRHFQDAKLAKNVLITHGIKNVILKPLLSFRNKPIEREASLEIWLTNPTEN